MNKNEINVGGNHKYLQISINTDNAKEILLSLFNEVKKHGTDLDALNNKVEQIQKSDKITTLDQMFEEYCNENNKKFQDLNNTINTLLNNFSNHQETIKLQIEKTNNKLQNNFMSSISDLETRITPLTALINRISKLQMLCDQLFSDEFTLERIKKLKNMEEDISQLKAKIKELEESQKKECVLISDLDAKKINNTSDAAKNVADSNNIEKNRSIKEDNNIKDDENSASIIKQENNSDNMDLNISQNKVSSLKKDESNIINTENKRNQTISISKKNEIIKTNTKIDTNKSNDQNNFNNNKKSSNKAIQSYEVPPIKNIENAQKGDSDVITNQKNDSTQAKNDLQSSKKSNKANKKANYDRLNMNRTQDKHQPNNNSKTTPLPIQNNTSISEREGFRRRLNSPQIPMKYNQHQNLNQTDLQKNKDIKKEKNNEHENDIADELKALKDLLLIQTQQLSSLMQPDSYLMSTIAMIVSDMLEKRKGEIDDHNRANLHHLCGEMRRNIDSMRSQVEIANNKISKCATKDELFNVADDLLNYNINDDINNPNTSIGATPICRCLACGRPRASVSTLSKMAKVNSPYILDKSLHAILNYRSLSDSVSIPNQNINSSPGARIKLLISEKNTKSAPQKTAPKTPPLDYNGLTDSPV